MRKLDAKLVAFADLIGRIATNPIYASFAEDITWLRGLRSHYIELVDQLREEDYLEELLSGWDEEAFSACIAHSLQAIELLEKLFPFDPYADSLREAVEQFPLDALTWPDGQAMLQGDRVTISPAAIAAEKGGHHG